MCWVNASALKQGRLCRPTSKSGIKNDGRNHTSPTLADDKGTQEGWLFESSSVHLPVLGGGLTGPPSLSPSSVNYWRPIARPAAAHDCTHRTRGIGVSCRLTRCARSSVFGRQLHNGPCRCRCITLGRQGSFPLGMLSMSIGELIRFRCPDPHWTGTRTFATTLL